MEAAPCGAAARANGGGADGKVRERQLQRFKPRALPVPLQNQFKVQKNAWGGLAREPLVR